MKGEPYHYNQKKHQKMAKFATGMNGDEDLGEDIKGGKIDFDVLIATPDAMRIIGQLGKVLASWRIASIVGIVGAVSSMCWFTAMSLINAALVRAMGQIELVFTVLTSLLIIRERVKLVEIVGMFVLVFGMFLLVD